MKQGDIWLINLDPTIGAEIRKTRPAIIVNNDILGRLPLKVIVPLTDWKESYNQAEWMVKIEVDKMNNLTKPSAADCFQIRSISEKRFINPIGTITNEKLNRISEAVIKVISHIT